MSRKNSNRQRPQTRVYPALQFFFDLVDGDCRSCHRHRQRVAFSVHDGQPRRQRVPGPVYRLHRVPVVAGPDGGVGAGKAHPAGDHRRFYGNVRARVRAHHRLCLVILYHHCRELLPRGHRQRVLQRLFLRNSRVFRSNGACVQGRAGR